jgi:acetate kinase
LVTGLAEMLNDERRVTVHERSRVRVFVIPTDEEVMIARHITAVLDRAAAEAGPSTA